MNSAVDYFYSAVYKENKGDMDGAIADFTRTIELYPKDAAGFFNRGVTKDAKGDHDGAIADYNRAIELDPKLAEFCSMKSAHDIRNTLPHPEHGIQ
jgi:tetratricopeptide (TPR) repeat protein